MVDTVVGSSNSGGIVGVQEYKNYKKALSRSNLANQLKSVPFRSRIINNN